MLSIHVYISHYSLTPLCILYRLVSQLIIYNYIVVVNSIVPSHYFTKKSKINDCRV